MDAKATIHLDDHELELIILSLTNSSDDEKFRGNRFRSDHYKILARKIVEEKVRFQDKHIKRLEEKYSIKEESLLR